MHTLENKIAIVTGAAGSIGAAIARSFVEHGAPVVLHYSGSRKRAEDLEQELARRGARAVCLQADFRQLDRCAASSAMSSNVSAG
jgi:3-oxoacyl-[acyl-carrier protein] reductase